MKKLIIAAAIVCAAAISQAAAISWKTGTMIKPDGTTTAGDGTLSLCVFLVDEKTYNDTSLSAIWSGYGAEKVADVKDAATYANTGKGSTGVTATQGASDVAASTTYYALLISTYDKDLDGKVDMYAVNKSSVSTNTSSNPTSTNPTSDLSKTIGGKSSGLGNVTWVAVPEPTSGLLLLLGMAGLALRRRRA